MGFTCDQFGPVLRIISYIIKFLRFTIPIILIVITSLDYFKIVTNANVDEKMVKDTQKKMTTRLVYAVIIFLIPVIVKLLFKVVEGTIPVGVDDNGTSWAKCIDSYF